MTYEVRPTFGNCPLEWLAPYPPEIELSIPLQSEVEMTITHKRTVWEFPKERFVTYEASDEKWARPLGFGREVEVEEKTIIPRAIVEFRDGQYVVVGAKATEPSFEFGVIE